MKSKINLTMTPTGDDQEMPHSCRGSGGTLLEALASLERDVRAFYGEEVLFARAIAENFMEFVSAMRPPGGVFTYFEMSCPEDAFQIVREEDERVPLIPQIHETWDFQPETGIVFSPGRGVWRVAECYRSACGKYQDAPVITKVPDMLRMIELLEEQLPEENPVAKRARELLWQLDCRENNRQTAAHAQD